MSTIPRPTDSSQDHRSADWESFFDAQRRNRRATWRMSALCVFAVLVMGLPLTLILTPLIYAAVLILAEMVDLVARVPPQFWQAAHTVARLGASVIDHFLNDAPVNPGALIAGIAAVLLPGMLLTLTLWLGLNAMFRGGGVGGALASLNAREPDKADLKELQLADVADEMAVAAGLPPPRVMMVDSTAPNAAAIGTSPADARVVVSRSAVDDLSREEMQSVLAHLVGSIGNGDLRIAFTITSVFETAGLLVTLINSPFGPDARATIRQIARHAARRATDETDRAAAAEAVAALLARNLELGEDDIDRFFRPDQAQRSAVRKLMKVLLFPLQFTNASMKATLWFFTKVLLGPCLAFLWRTRRYLADASAVQLTRNPDSLATALRRLTQDSGAMIGGAWASHLFIVSPNDGKANPRQPFQRVVSFNRQPFHSVVSFHPPLNGRLERLERMGAHIARGTPQRISPMARVGVLICGPLLVMAAFLMLFSIAGLIAMNLVFTALWLAAIHGLFGLFGQ